MLKTVTIRVAGANIHRYFIKKQLTNFSEIYGAVVFNKVAGPQSPKVNSQYGCFPLHLGRFFRTAFLRNTV